jgi:four helix bundle protein
MCPLSYSHGVSDFKKLKVWRKAHALALNIHRAVSRIRGRDSVSLRSQMLRAAMSIPANIVEGAGHANDREYARFVRIALGSTSELEYHLIIARDTSVFTKSDFDSLSAQTIEVRKMLFGLLRRLDGEIPTPVKSVSSELATTS